MLVTAMKRMKIIRNYEHSSNELLKDMDNQLTNVTSHERKE